VKGPHGCEGPYTGVKEPHCRREKAHADKGANEGERAHRGEF